MKNPYKRTDVFSCNYRSHAKFDNRVSAYHVLCSKKCFPQGCYFFTWSCALKNKGRACRRGYNYVGRLCEGCMHFTDHKTHYQPRLLLSRADYERFLSEVEEFEEWVEEQRGRELEVLCEVSGVKPHFCKTIAGRRTQLRLEGYLAVIRRGFIGLTEFDDVFYASLTLRQQEELALAAGDRFEALGRVTLDRGRVVIERLRRVQVEARSGMPSWNAARALVARATAVEFDHRPESCVRCPHGALVDVISGENGRRRTLFCLQGVTEPTLCALPAFEKLDMCIN